MAINLGKVLKKVNVLSELMVDREKGSTEELIKLGKVHINAVDYIEITNESGGKEMVYVFNIEEEEDKFYFAGTVLKDKFNQIVNDKECFAGDYTAFYEEVENQTIAVEFRTGKTKKGKSITLVEFFED